MFGVFNPINKGPELAFEVGDPRTFPPEPLSFDPKEVVNFKTALPHGLQFIPVLSSNSKHDLKFMLAHQTCPKWESISRDRLYRANDRLLANSHFESSLRKVEEFLGIDDAKTFTAATNRSAIEKCFRLKIKYQDYIETERKDQPKGAQLSSHLEEFLGYCEAYYWLVRLDDHHYSRL